ncbi:MAG: ATP-dependent DNA helicase [Robiginitomaculum sp.]|nr:MAG: ATP-dependent DNA helicase [Robiginitomaculum sp.]
MTSDLSAALGPTNTGKTYLAVTRMLAHADGVIGLPLRLLAREVYERIVREKGVEQAALVTGEERIVPKSARYFACTAEAMPTHFRGRPFCFMAIDEVQLCADPERGHVFTNHLLHSRGSEETLVLGAATMQGVLHGLAHADQIEPRMRFSQLTHTGPCKLSRLPKRSAIIAFSAEDVYAIAELLRRRHGGAAVVMGSLSPRTRNAQAALFQSGEVDYLVATDAIGMGLNMDVNHVAFAALTKFDGQRRRALRADELGQIAGRAGRYQTDGTFGTTASAPAFDEAMIRRLEEHDYERVRALYWRNRVLDFASTGALQASLQAPVPRDGLIRVSRAIDAQVLGALAEREDFTKALDTPEGVRRLWQVCQIPDFRKSGPDAHARLLGDIFAQLSSPRGRIEEDWLAGKLKALDHLKGGVDAISSRLAHVRTWAYCTHRADWIGDAVHWQAQAHALEERLSDALHDRLLQRFVDQRTSVLARALNAGEEADAVVLPDGEVKVLEHTIGHLEGLSFRPGSAARDLAGKTLRMVANAALAPEINRRLSAIVAANDEVFCLADDGAIHWEGAAIARLKADSDALHPLVNLIGGQLGHDAAQDKAQTRVQDWLDGVIARDLKPLLGLRAKVDAGEIIGLGRGLGFRLIEAMGALPRHQIASELRDLDQPSRHALRQCGVRFGAFHVFMPALIRPASARLLSLLFAAAAETDTAAFLPRPGLTAYMTQESVHAPAARVAGYALFSRRLVRIDILERLADLIREAQKAHKGGIFSPNEAMLSLLGCSHDDLGKILIALKYQCKRKKDDAGKGETWAPVHLGHQKQAKKKAPAQKPTIDPDSPFAVLQALK